LENSPTSESELNEMVAHGRNKLEMLLKPVHRSV